MSINMIYNRKKGWCCYCRPPYSSQIIDLFVGQTRGDDDDGHMGQVNMMETKGPIIVKPRSSVEKNPNDGKSIVRSPAKLRAAAKTRALSSKSSDDELLDDEGIWEETPKGARGGGSKKSGAGKTKKSGGKQKTKKTSPKKTKKTKKTSKKTKKTKKTSPKKKQSSSDGGDSGSGGSSEGNVEHRGGDIDITDSDVTIENA
uniref:Uncharacterized protein n=1 Tax=Romanomermis culicivorax TaxID=13658 RepID=A0A915K3X3_ROMCU